jgi:protein-S-isoprenylcysteine O-methyltransferase Ste14
VNQLEGTHSAASQLAATVVAPRPLLVRAFWRWLTIAAVSSVLLVLYLRHPYYARPEFDTWRALYQTFFAAWIVLGLPYVAATLWRFPRLPEAMSDGALHWMIILRSLSRQNRIVNVWLHKRLRTTVLSVVIKVFFAPLILSFFTLHVGSLMRTMAAENHVALLGSARAPWSLTAVWHYIRQVSELLPERAHLARIMHPSAWTRDGASWACGLCYEGVLAVDCCWAVAGYCLESRWLNNKTKSVDATALGWAAALFCYPPFNSVLSTFLPLASTGHVVTSQTGLLVCRVLGLAAFTIYAAATVALGLKFSNLTNRGIVARGPYRFVRHPAYLSKSCGWWLEYLPTLTPTTAFFLLGVNGVYVLRAWTEERHLSSDPAYGAYKQTVRWLLVPYVY